METTDLLWWVSTSIAAGRIPASFCTQQYTMQSLSSNFITFLGTSRIQTLAGSFFPATCTVTAEIWTSLCTLAETLVKKTLFDCRINIYGTFLKVSSTSFLFSVLITAKWPSKRTKIQLPESSYLKSSASKILTHLKQHFLAPSISRSHGKTGSRPHKMTPSKPIRGTKFLKRELIST